MTDFTIIWRSLTSRLFSTVITMLMVAIAVGLMLLLLSMRDSKSSFERGIGNMHMLVSRDASPLVSVLNGVFYANPPRAPIEWAKYEQLRADPSLRLDFAVPVQQGDSYQGLPVLATNEDFFTRYQPAVNAPWSLTEGRFFERPFEVVVGARAAKEAHLSLDDELFLTHGIALSRQRAESDADAVKPHVHREFSYRVVGILDTTGGPHDRALFTDLISTWIIHAHDRRKRDDSAVTDTTEADLIEGDRLITGVYLRVATRPGRASSASEQAVFDKLRRDTSITVADPTQQVGNLFRIVGNIDQILLAMAVVVMISSAISIMLALYNSMEQRRRQIAVLRVLGASRERIFGLVVTESAIIGIAGGIVGVGLAAVGGTLVAAEMKHRLGLIVEPSLPLQSTAIVVVGTILLAAVAGVVPALMGYRTAVVRNLRPFG